MFVNCFKFQTLTLLITDIMEESVHHRRDSKKLAQMNLPLCLAADAVCGWIAGLAVAPTCTIVDKSVILNANGSIPLWQAVKQGIKSFVFKPLTFMKTTEFKLIFFVYSSTYIAANSSQSICIAKDKDPVIPKLLTTFAVNTVASIWKDKLLTQHFGQKQKTAFPLKSYVLFWTRDVITIAFAFTFPKIFGKWLSQRSSYSYSEATKIFQMICPLLIQFAATPLHLLGLDFYNNPNRTAMQRAKFLVDVGGQTLLLRMCRFLPAYGLAGVLNIVLRDHIDNMIKDAIDKE